MLDLQTVVSSDHFFTLNYKNMLKVAGQLIEMVENYSLKLLPFVKIYKENINQEKLSEDVIDLDNFKDLIIKHQQQ